MWYANIHTGKTIREKVRDGEREREKETDRWVGGQANRQTGRLTDKTDRYR